MENNSNISLPREKCIQCQEESTLLMSSCFNVGVIGHCDHKFCQSCFRKENINLAFKCPYCKIRFDHNTESIEEAILIGEAATVRIQISPRLFKPAGVEIEIEGLKSIHESNKLVVDKLESALQLNPTNFYTLYLLFVACSHVHKFLLTYDIGDSHIEFYYLRLFDYLFKVIDHPAIERHDLIKSDCYYELSHVFYVYRNYSASLKYAKLVFERCLRSSDHTNLPFYKAEYFKARAAFAKLPPLRFAVGDEVEFLHELETGTESEWKLGKIVELHYWERRLDINFNAPYRLQLLDDSADYPLYVWVKADLDRYVRKVGVRSIEDTRYQARLDAKVAELAHVYCSEDFMQNIYRTLAQDRDFVDMLHSVWQVELAENSIYLYRMLVMHRLPLIRTDTGYHVPSTEEVIAGIRAYFDPIHLSGDAAPSAAGEGAYSQEIRDEIMSRFRGTLIDSHVAFAAKNAQYLMFDSISYYLGVLARKGHLDFSVGLFTGGRFTIPSEMSDACSKATVVSDLWLIQMGAVRLDDGFNTSKLGQYLSTWVTLHASLEKPGGTACECPFVYFFVKYCLDQGWGVPKLALAVYDRMNMQLSREFIRCANPTCEHSKLDKSTGKVKFKQCSRCKSVIYCSRECQTAHYPEHKGLCREYSTG